MNKIEIEAIIWIYLPIIIAVTELILSLRITIHKNSYFDSIASFLVLVMNGLSIYILIAILEGGWPTYTPHLAIFISTILTVIQILRRKRNIKLYE